MSPMQELGQHFSKEAERKAHLHQVIRTAAACVALVLVPVFAVAGWGLFK